MLQAVMVNPARIEFHEVEKPRPNPDQVLIRIKHIGVCGSDIHVYHGLHPYTRYPIVQGHECSGLIAEAGANVQGFSPGDAVVFMPQVTCGECYSCRHGMYHICDQLKVIGFQANGAAQEFFPIEAEMVLKLPPAINLEQAAMIEPIAVGVHAVSRAGDLNGKNVLVLGAGTIGNLVGQSARAMGAAKVLMADISSYKLGVARQCNLPDTVNPQSEDLSQAVLNTMGPDRADLIIECVGVQDTITQAIACARKGSTIIVVGVFGKKPEVDIGLVQDRELTVTGSLMYQKVDFEKAIELVENGKLVLDPLITHRFPFRQYLQAYEYIEAAGGNSLKVMIELD